MKLLSDLIHLRQCYLTRHAECRFPLIPLADGGEGMGFVEECVFRQGFLTLRGWTLAHRMSVEVDGQLQPVSRCIQRGDVAAELGARMVETHNQHGRVGFEVTVQWSGGPVRLMVEDMPDITPWPLPLPTESMILAARRQTRAAFRRDFVRAAVPGVKYLLSGRKPVHRERLRTIFRLGVRHETSLLLDTEFLAPPSARTAELPAITIILPVYNAFDLLTEAVERVDHHTDVPWHLVLIEDASTDPRVLPWLNAWASQRSDRVTLLVNDCNLGFIGSVNRGLRLSAERGGPVVLLNSDAFVPQGWASRLLGPILASDNVASVTPMSNDATIMSVPWIAGRVALNPGNADQIDATARNLSTQSQALIPTGIGFCMAMSRAALNLVPELDPAFGRGYGEEVDWCRKTAAAGMTHVGIGNLFIEHRGGESFGSATKAKAVDGAARIINRRYPEFEGEVRRFIAADPLLTARLCLALAYAGAAEPDPLHVYVGHSLGGGAEHWLAARIDERIKQNRRSVVIRVGGARRFRIELHAEDGMLAGETDAIEVVRNLIQRIPHRHIIYSCGVGDERPWELPDLLCDLAAGSGSVLDIMFHDYFPISPSFNLLNADGSYTGVPPPSSTDAAHQILVDSIHVSLRSWRERWGRAVRRADRLVVFSTNNAGIVEAAWPDVEGKIACEPHKVLTDVPVMQALRDRPGVIGILGAIGRVKGAQVISDLAYHLEAQADAPQLLIIGEFDHSFSLPPAVHVTGRYEPGHLPGILSSSRVTAWLMPSVWPETFSFTTHEMLATGLPVMAFDLGAQGEAVRRAANGHIVTPDPATIYQCYQRLSGKNCADR
ncbi:glycosyltransferase [Paracoccus panacisoli]|uniref:Glycosyltransferase n=1 Tax=Paracoccus panacisoli TaxID=1510163 RepID=A0ABV6T6W5_9RHOB